MVFQSKPSAGDDQMFRIQSLQNEAQKQKNKTKNNNNAPTQDALHHFRSAVMVRRPLASTDAASIFMTHYTYITNTHAAQIQNKYNRNTKQGQDN